MKIEYATVFFIVLSLGYLSSSGSAMQDSRHQRIQNNIVTIGLASVPEDLDPRHMWNVHHLKMIPLVFQNLVNRSSDGKYLSGLAKSWEFTNEGKTIIFHLDDYFTPGETRITALEIARSISSHFWTSSKSIMKGFLASQLVNGNDLVPDGSVLSGIKIISDNTISFGLRKPNSNILEILSLPGFAIIPELNKNNFKKPIGTGPMTGKYSELDRSWTFVSKSSDGPNGRQTIIIKEISDIKKSNLIDFETFDVIIDLPRLDDSTNGLPKDWNRYDFQAFQFSHLFFNLNRGSYFKDIRNRKTVQKIFRSVRGELSESSASFLPLDAYLPFGVMPSSYYNREVAQALRPSELNRLKKSLNHSKCIFLLVTDYLPSRFPALLIEKLKNLNLNIGVRLIRKFELANEVRSGNYDLASLSYVGTAASPQTFLAPLLRESNFTILRLPPNQYLKLKKTISSSEMPINVELMNTLREFENNAFVIPMYHIKPAILTHKGIEFEFNKFQFESNLAGFRWRLKVNK